MSFLRILATGVIIGVITFAVIDTLANRTTADVSVSSSSLPFTDASDVPTSFFDAKRCDADQKDRVDCYDRFMHAYAGNKEPKELLAELASASKEDTTILVDCHPISHAIGRLNFEQTKDVSAAFDRCDATCFSGCYHGSIERVFFTDEELKAGEKHASEERIKSVINTICPPEKFPAHIGLVQCIHGAGHAVMHGLDYDLMAALRSCDEFNDDVGKSFCYSGVFMENITAADKDRRTMNRDDPLYPCDLPMDDKYLGTCLFYQPSFLLEYGYTPQLIINTCRSSKIPNECIQGYGRELAGDIRLGFAGNVANTCEVVGEGDTESCSRGVINSALENSQNGDAAYLYCQALQKQENKDFCFRWAGWYSFTELGFSPDRVFEDCTKYSVGEEPGCTLAKEAAVE